MPRLQSRSSKAKPGTALVDLRFVQWAFPIETDKVRCVADGCGRWLLKADHIALVGLAKFPFGPVFGAVCVDCAVAMGQEDGPPF